MTQSKINTIQEVYNREQILDSICVRLNTLDNYYCLNNPQQYEVLDEGFYNFFIYDLIDSLNFTPNKMNELIKFKNHHVYHIGSLRSRYKVSVIMILENDKLHFFEGLNCCNNIDSIDDVLDYVTNKYTFLYGKDVIERIKKYNSYQRIISIDPQGKIPKCECKGKT